MKCPALKRHSAPPNNAAFTLLELLIAMMLTSVIGVVLFSTYRMVLENGQSLQKIVGERETGRMVKAVIDNDITSIILFSDNKLLPRPSQNPINLSAEYYEESGKTAPEEDLTVVFSFATTHSLVSTVKTPTPAPVCVEYVLKDSKKGQNLIRRERAYCGIDVDLPWTDILMLQGLKSIEVAMLVETEYLVKWSGYKEAPSAVRFIFAYEDTIEDEEEFETFIIPILPQEIDINDT